MKPIIEEGCLVLRDVLNMVIQRTLVGSYFLQLKFVGPLFSLIFSCFNVPTYEKYHEQCANREKAVEHDTLPIRYNQYGGSCVLFVQ